MGGVVVFLLGAAVAAFDSKSKLTALLVEEVVM